MDDTSSGAGAPEAPTDGSFDAHYFAHCCGHPYLRDEHWLSFFGAIAERIATQMQPRRALDAGCALGILVEALRARGIEADGIDLSSYAIDRVHDSVRPFCRRGSIADEFSDRYDLIVCIEVLEHMTAREGEAAIANICRHTDDVLFSSSPSDHREPSHVNVQPPEYWAEQFARHGFYRDVDFDASFLTAWAVRFRRSREPLPRIIRNYERQFAALAAARNEARSFSVEGQRELARVEQRAAALEAERNEARATIEAGTGPARAALFEATQQIVDLVKALDEQRAAVAQARVEIERERTELPSVRAALEETHAHLTRKIAAVEALEAGLAASRVEFDRIEHELQHARETIARMETSVFWRARRVWAGLSRALGRPT
ncbi:MAG: hypothetical protein A3H96_23780 [Acidobacteria bacterium RIFCSPLOWO2_02_FULL_67_36]|nr:MAG: hypothetical protein A3H96_23780 [Acidobacteria bacterium RIFCSPLOWO2_02_FULL_67_36]OFW20994.1 MAG: hypothetical protein A3G21_23715 [Acidobacteria bacterium RIFCSPLOWO2_12_FULL_66_21]